MKLTFSIQRRKQALKVHKLVIVLARFRAAPELFRTGCVVERDARHIDTHPVYMV